MLWGHDQVRRGRELPPRGAAQAELHTLFASASLALSTGARIPQVGPGVWQSPRGDATRDAVQAALRSGYRHVDTARIYGNEADVGAAVRASGDLYLIHWPVAGKRLDSWRALEKVFAEKRARAIGVSNFLKPHLEELLGRAHTAPAVNQIELSPFLQRRETRALCDANRIVVEAYSPLTRGKRLDHPAVQAVARRVKRSGAQVLLRWGVQHGLVVLPKSTHAERIAENGALFDFELDPASMAEMDGIDEGFTTGWDPATQR